MKKLLIAIASALALGAALSSRASDNNLTLSRNLTVLNSVVKELSTAYVDTIDAKKLLEFAIEAMLYQGTDPYTEYYPWGDQDEILSISEGSYAGIGSAIVKRGNSVYISAPYWNSPAHAAGLRPGDRIVAVDGDTVRPTTDVSDVSRRLRGQAGTSVSVDIARPYVDDSLLTVEIVRRDITVSPLPYYGRLDNGVGYIRLEQFNESSARKVKAALTDLMAAGDLPGLIIDLRDNGGGLLEGAVQIAGLFVPKGTEIVRTRGRDAMNERIYKTAETPLAPELPLAILINGNTASASEILAGSLQDLDRAVIAGECSFGKGLVQTTRPLPFNGMLKLTTGRYYIPSGRLIQAIDYSHRNADGDAERVPDSLTHTFSTRAGRTVRDGGGITPDTVMPSCPVSRFVYSLGNEFGFFDFANRHYASHPEAPEVGSAIADSALFLEFKAMVDSAGFKYDRPYINTISALRDAVSDDGFLDDSISAHLDALSAMLQQNLDRDFEFHRDEIMESLEIELASRYFSESDRVRHSLPSDTVVAATAALLLDSPAYRRILR